MQKKRGLPNFVVVQSEIDSTGKQDLMLMFRDWNSEVGNKKE